MEFTTVAALLGLGALHGINPGMGWLFAVAKGLQDMSRGAVIRTLLPLAAGHGAAVAATLVVAALLGEVITPGAVRWLVAGALLATGAWQLVRHRHVRGRGMRVSSRQIAVWSFLMSLAHGAGLMVLPVVMADPGQAGGHQHHGAAMASVVPQLPGLAAAALHTAGYLLVMGAVALVVYEKLGLRLLRNYWFNLDLVWAVALVVTACVVIW
jgi:hypothetical protein